MLESIANYSYIQGIYFYIHRGSSNSDSDAGADK
jgi:hypothetical protein